MRVRFTNQPSTAAGKVIAGTRVEEFSKLVKLPVHVPLSGRTMVFDSKGVCSSGC